jgi:hypothetical protein
MNPQCRLKVENAAYELQIHWHNRKAPKDGHVGPKDFVPLIHIISYNNKYGVLTVISYILMYNITHQDATSKTVHTDFLSKYYSI